MAQVRYQTAGAAERKADSLANIVRERDVITLAASQYPSIAATEPTVLVVEVKNQSWAVLQSNGSGAWTEV
jgi:hypothetical protein